jgi:hypothetical protein
MVISPESLVSLREAGGLQALAVRICIASGFCKQSTTNSAAPFAHGEH